MIWGAAARRGLPISCGGGGKMLSRPAWPGALMAAGKQPLINRAFHRAELAQVDDTALATILGDTANTMFLRGT